MLFPSVDRSTSEEAPPPVRTRERVPSPHRTEVPSPARRRVRPRHAGALFSSVDWSASPRLQQLLLPEEVQPDPPRGSMDMAYTPAEEPMMGEHGIFSFDPMDCDARVPPTGSGLFAGRPSLSFPGESSRAPGSPSFERQGFPEYTPADYESMTVSQPFWGDSIAPVNGPGPVLGGFDYQSEIGHRHASVPDSRHVETLECNVIFLRDLISQLDPSSPDSLDGFIADANSALDFLAHFGLDEEVLRYWEELCREAEFLVRRLKPLGIVRTRASLPDLRERVRIQREAVHRAGDDLEQSAEDMRKYHQRSKTTSAQVEGISTKVKTLWREIRDLMSCKSDLQVEYERQARVVAREQSRHRIRQQSRTSAETALARSEGELQAAEAEYQVLTEAVAQLRNLQSRLP